MRDMKIYWARLPIHTGKVDMIILAVSTSAKYPSAALCSDSDSSRRTIIVQTDESGKPHSVSLMPLIDSMLEKAGLQLSDIDLFAVDAGPGSFTGVRIGVTTVNAFAYAEKSLLQLSARLPHSAMRRRGGSATGFFVCWMRGTATVMLQFMKGKNASFLLARVFKKKCSIHCPAPNIS